MWSKPGAGRPSLMTPKHRLLIVMGAIFLTGMACLVFTKFGFITYLAGVLLGFVLRHVSSDL